MRIVKKNNNSSLIPKILVVPLDWGLGHATRCIPIIAEIIEQNCEVFIASEGYIYNLFKNEFPQVKFLSGLSYKLEFSKSKNFLSWKLIKQFPAIAFRIYKEHQWLKKIIKKYNIDAVISDNRFGLYNERIHSVYITHQLMIKTGNTFIEKLAQHIHYFFIKKYDECWVPDFENNGLAGELSHPKRILQNVKYIGALSRFEKKDEVQKKYDLLISLSGPEPQRTILEELILKQLLTYNGKALLVRGMPGNEKILQSNSSIKIVNHLPGKELAMAIEEADIVISRSGYTTIMDLVKLNKKAIFIPTPGQTEQLYLANYLIEKKMFFSVEQDKFDLTETLEKFSKFSSVIPSFDMNQYKLLIEDFVTLLKQN